MVRAEQLMGAASDIRANLTKKATNRAAREVASFDGWYSPALEQELSLTLGNVADNAATISARQAETYGSSILAKTTGRTPKASALLLAGSARIGVDAATAYARIPKRYGYMRSIGYGEEAARASVIDRVRRMVGLEIALASRMQMQRLFSRNTQTITGYRRVIRPELSKTGTCGLCIAASDRIYNAGELMPIHPGCYCEVMPIVGDYDPGFSLNTADITRLYRTADPGREIGAPTRSQLSSVHVVVEDHGEYGPMLRGSKDAIKNIDTLRAQERARLGKPTRE